MNIEEMKFNVDPRTAVCFGVGGLLAGAVLGGVLVHYVEGRRVDARLEDREDEVTAHYLAREERIRREQNATIEQQAVWIANHIAEPYQSPAMAEESFDIDSVPGRSLDEPDDDTERDAESDGLPAGTLADIDNAAVERAEQWLRERRIAEKSHAPRNLFADVADGRVDQPDESAVPVPGPGVGLGDSDVVGETPQRGPMNANTAPHVITADEYGETGNKCITIFYYSEDGVLVDDRNVPVRDMVTLVGTNRLDSEFGNDPDNPDVVLVRCPRLSTDFEVCRRLGSYAEQVFGPNLVSQKIQPPRVVVRNRERPKE